jgi:hypothetical protein
MSTGKTNSASQDTVRFKLQNKTFTENGTFTADEDYFGFGEIIIDVDGYGADSTVEAYDNINDEDLINRKGKVFVKKANKLTTVLSRNSHTPNNGSYALLPSLNNYILTPTGVRRYDEEGNIVETIEEFNINSSGQGSLGIWEYNNIAGIFFHHPDITLIYEKGIYNSTGKRHYGITWPSQNRGDGMGANNTCYTATRIDGIREYFELNEDYTKGELIVTVPSGNYYPGAAVINKDRSKLVHVYLDRYGAKLIYSNIVDKAPVDLFNTSIDDSFIPNDRIISYSSTDDFKYIIINGHDKDSLWYINVEENTFVKQSFVSGKLTYYPHNQTLYANENGLIKQFKYINGNWVDQDLALPVTCVGTSKITANYDGTKLLVHSGSMSNDNWYLIDVAIPGDIKYVALKAAASNYTDNCVTGFLTGERDTSKNTVMVKVNALESEGNESETIQATLNIEQGALGGELEEADPVINTTIDNLNELLGLGEE